MDKRFWIIIGIIVLIFGGIVYKDSQNKPTVTTATTSHYTGNLGSKVTLVEYGDFQCSACGYFYPVVQEVKKAYSDRVRFQFRNLPLQQVHPNAFAGARAAEAASEQNKFWEMHDLLYENQDRSGQSGWVASKDPLSLYFVKFAEQLGLNIPKFKADFASEKVNTRINADMDAFKAMKQPMSTPSFFIDGRRVDSARLSDASGAPSIAGFSKVLDEALAKAK